MRIVREVSRLFAAAALAAAMWFGVPGFARADSNVVSNASPVDSTGNSRAPLTAPGLTSTDGGTISGSLATNGIVSTALSPAAPTVTATGGTGTTWYYCDTQSTGAGESTCSADGTVSGGATLSGTVYNTISGTVLAGASAVTIYQCSSAACTTTYKMGSATITGSSYSYKDTTGSTAGAPAVTFNASGAVLAGGVAAPGVAISIPNGAYICLSGDNPCTGFIYKTGSAVGANGLGFGGATAFFDTIGDWSGSTPLNLSHNAGTKIGSSGTAVKNHLSGACTPSAGVCTQIADTSAAATSACLATSTATGGTSPCYCTVAAGTGFTPTCPGTTTAPISYVIEDQ